MMIPFVRAALSGQPQRQVFRHRPQRQRRQMGERAHHQHSAA